MKNKVLKMNFILLVLMFVFCGCTKKNTSVSTQSNEKITPQPHSTATEPPVQDETTYSGEASVSVVQSVAYVFPNLTDNELYAACEYTNTSNCPCIIKSINYQVIVGDATISIDATQPAAMYCPIYPGETFYNAVWHKASITENTAATIDSIIIECEKTTEKMEKIAITDLYHVQNYPDFLTVSGTITNNSADMELNEVYLGFYDSAEKLLGVWYFTDAYELATGNSKHFTTHLRSLPIPQLAENTKTIKAQGFGFNIKEG